MTHAPDMLSKHEELIPVSFIYLHLTLVMEKKVINAYFFFPFDSFRAVRIRFIHLVFNYNVRVEFLSMHLQEEYPVKLVTGSTPRYTQL